MKGLLFGGCSFTWGQGLYFYSELPNLFNPSSETYFGDKVTDSHKKFAETLRYPRLVANHFKTFEVFKNINGGSEDETFQFFKRIFNDPKKILFDSNVCYERYIYEDFSYVIIQLSHIYRNKFYFELDGEKCFTNSRPINGWDDTTKLEKWMEINNYSVGDWLDQLKKEQYERLLKELKFYESKGIQTKILSWHNDLIEHIKNDEFLNERFIQIRYEDKVYDTIHDLQTNHSEMYIKSDPYFNGYVYSDHHPSKKCHEIIANSIIYNLEKK
jgi:hypothetical protein